MQGHGVGIRCGQVAEDRTEKTAFPMAFVGVGKARQDRVSSLGLAGLSVFCGLSAIEMLSTWLGMIKAEEYGLLGGVQDKERGGMALNWFFANESHGLG